VGFGLGEIAKCLSDAVQGQLAGDDSRDFDLALSDSPQRQAELFGV
jgi:hypothetical protein